MKKSKCNCNGEFHAETAYKRLSEKYNDLIEIITDNLVEENRMSVGRSATPELSLSELLIRIIGGKKVLPGDYPDCCLVGKQNGNGTLEWFCTGVLIHPRIIVTAAHCYKSNFSYVVALDTINQNALSDAEIITVKKAIPHPSYSQTWKFNDISVLVLSKNANTPPVLLATSNEINAARRTTLVGFGNDDVYSTVGFGTKRDVTVDIISIRTSRQDNLDEDESRYDYESDLEFVAGGNGYDSCNGDSGGPAYIIVDGVRKLAGLTSRSTKGAVNPCGEGGIYSRIDAHVDFIKSLTP
nr:serine protease [uncultured Flavobacterium sp.]